MSLDATLDNNVLSLILDRPERYNAIDPELRDQLVESFDTAAQRGAARAIVLRGNGRGFCAGADLKADASEYYGIEVEQHMSQSTYRLARAVINCRVPVVVAVHGACAGIGLTLALGADLCIAADSAGSWGPSSSVRSSPTAPRRDCCHASSVTHAQGSSSCSARRSMPTRRSP